MKLNDRINFVISIFLEVVLAADIVIAIVGQKVSLISFVCIALIAMLQIGVNMLNDYYNRKNSNKE